MQASGFLRTGRRLMAAGGETVLVDEPGTSTGMDIIVVPDGGHQQKRMGHQPWMM
jgi:hypothetical protein